MAARICSICGYEGRGKRASKGGGGAFRLLGMLTLLPLYSLWRLVSGRSGNMCPHCGTKTMVKMNSDAGWLAKQKVDIELGLVKPKVETKAESFGNERPAEKQETKKPVNPEEW